NLKLAVTPGQLVNVALRIPRPHQAVAELLRNRHRLTVYRRMRLTRIRARDPRLRASTRLLTGLQRPPASHRRSQRPSNSPNTLRLRPLKHRIHSIRRRHAAVHLIQNRSQSRTIDRLSPRPRSSLQKPLSHSLIEQPRIKPRRLQSLTSSLSRHQAANTLKINRQLTIPTLRIPERRNTISLSTSLRHNRRMLTLKVLRQQRLITRTMPLNRAHLHPERRHNLRSLIIRRHSLSLSLRRGLLRRLSIPASS